MSPIKPMRFDVALVCAGSPLALARLPGEPDVPRRRGSGTSCPSGSQYRGSGFAEQNRTTNFSVLEAAWDVMPADRSTGQWLLPDAETHSYHLPARHDRDRQKHRFLGETHAS